MKIRKFILIFALLFSALFIIVIINRNLVLNYLIAGISEKLKIKYHATFSLESAHFIDLRTVFLENILIIPPGGDTLVMIKSLEINPSYSKIFIGKISYHTLKINDISVRLVSNGQQNNYSFLTETNKASKGDITTDSPQFGNRLHTLFAKIFELITGETIINNFQITYSSPDHFRKYQVPEFISDGKKYSCKVFNLSQKDPITWAVNGQIKKSERGIDFKMIRESSANTMVSLTDGEKSLKWLVDTLYFDAYSSSYQNNEMKISINGGFSNLQINYWRISPDDVTISTGIINFNIIAGKNFISIDTTSQLVINKFNCQVGFGYEDQPGKTYSLKIYANNISSSDLFESLPTGMFNTLQGIKTAGELSYHLDFRINKEMPDSLIFSSDLKKSNFRILKFGADYLPRINEEFLYTAYDKDRAVRTFPVGPSNPDYVPYDQICYFLKSAVMTAEDGSFFLHGGFNEEAFRQSIATNFKEGRFARGGSTITMQLVKNVYLSRNKTISRKLEEALLVWLIEKNHLVSKERMFEVYLNIIEWGPDIYGIKEASMFYFSKLPSQLTLAESIYLASIIPHPKYFKYSFDQTGQLKPFLSGYFKLVSDRMLRKTWISEEEYNQLQPVINLNGPALQYILPADTIPIDSVSTDEIDFIN